jgi:hypothetical protein
MNYKLFTILGFDVNAYDGTPDWHNNPASPELIEAVNALPLMDDFPGADNSEFLALDLSFDKRALALQALVTDEQWQAIVDFHEEFGLKTRGQKYLQDPILVAHLVESSSDEKVIAKVATLAATSIQISAQETKIL